MPGKASLAAGEYYAHPRNAFWGIIATLFDFDPALPYAERVATLTAHGMAVWDVMRTCTRESSLDSDIVESSIVPNDFQSFFISHPQVTRVYFNGAKAEQSYRKYVLPQLSPESNSRVYLRLPSTSPANATVTLEAKLSAWKLIVR